MTHRSGLQFTGATDQAPASERYYQLTRPPFAAESATPFFFRSQAHAAALEGMLSAASQGAGVIVLTGEPGSGKTTVCQALCEELGEEPLAILSPDPTRSRHDLRARVSQFLKSSRRPLQSPVVIFDDVHSVDYVADDLLTLSDLETDDMHFVIVLAGPPPLWREVASMPLYQKKSVPGWCELGPLTKDEVEAYVRHRLAAAGGLVSRLHFSSDALECVAEESGGLPRAINAICERAIERGYVTRAARIDRAMMAGTRPTDVYEASAPVHAVEERRPSVDTSGLAFDFDLASLPPAQVSPIERPTEARSRGRRRRWSPLRPVLATAFILACLVAAGLPRLIWRSSSAQQPIASAPRPAPVKPLPSRRLVMAYVPAGPAERFAAASSSRNTDAYLIEAGTFRHADGATALVQQLRAFGLLAFDRTLDRGPRGTLQQVLVGPYDGRAAEAALARIRQLPGYGDATMRRTQQH